MSSVVGGFTPSSRVTVAARNRTAGQDEVQATQLDPEIKDAAESEELHRSAAVKSKTKSGRLGRVIVALTFSPKVFISKRKEEM